MKAITITKGMAIQIEQSETIAEIINVGIKQIDANIEPKIILKTFLINLSLVLINWYAFWGYLNNFTTLGRRLKYLMKMSKG